jgi:branched-chain amino acid transport system substrate-binding protein
MFRKTRTYESLVSLLILIVILAGCGSASATQPPAASAATAAPAAASTEPYKFAVGAPMTGDVAENGKYVLEGIQTAVDEINAAGGVNGRQLAIQVFDDKCDSTEAALVASRVAADPSFFAVLGHMCSAATMAAGPIYEKAGLTFMTASSTRPDLTSQGWTHCFRTITHDAGWGPILTGILVKKLDKKTVALFYQNDDYGIGLLNSVKPELEKAGVKILVEETFRTGDKDFSAQLAKVKQSGAEAIMLLTMYTEGALITRQRVSAGLAAIPVIASSQHQFPGFLDLAGDAAEGAIIGVAWDKWSTDPAVKALNDKWIEKFGQPCNEVNSYYYDAVYIMKQAIEEGATKETLPDVLHKIHFEGPTGVTEFQENGDIKPKMLFAMTVKDGQFTSYDLSDLK